MIILGAGYAGLIAAHFFPIAHVYEAREFSESQHNALLRFRSPDLLETLNIPVTKVPVTKGIWDYETFQQPWPKFINEYSLKVTGEIGARSILNIDPCVRYLAPRDLWQRLYEPIQDRVHFGCRFNGFDPIVDDEIIMMDGPDQFDVDGPIISTIPLPQMLDLVLEPFPHGFSYKPIVTYRYPLKRPARASSTVYFPALHVPFYRASIAGQDLILEAVEDVDVNHHPFRQQIRKALGIWHEVDWENGLRVPQTFGKIAPVPDLDRRQAIYKLTREFGVYSLGRFATWRNILLDDLLNDCKRIKSMMNMDSYSLHMEQ